MVTATREKSLITRGEFANRRRGSGRMRSKRWQSLVKAVPRDIDPIYIFFSFQHKNTGNYLQLVLLHEVLRQVAGGVCDNSDLHRFSRSSQSSRYLRFQSIRKRYATTRPQGITCNSCCSTKY